MGLIQDFWPVVHKHTLTFIQHHQEEGDVVSFEFERPAGIYWKAGQHGVFTFPTAKIKGRFFRVFSIASSPGEKVIRIATRLSEPPSDFKQHMMHLRRGDIMAMRGPCGPFHVTDCNAPVIFIAGGIGITPFMGLLREFMLQPETAPPKSYLVYSHSQNLHAFRPEISEIDKDVASLHVCLVAHREEVAHHLGDIVSVHGNTVTCFVAGTGAMIRATKRYLKKLGITGRNIRSDWFFGY